MLTGAFLETLSLAAQATQAARELQRNLEADSVGVAHISRMWCATVSAHQRVCADLASWPRYPVVSRLIAYLGAPLPPLRAFEHAQSLCLPSADAIDVQPSSESQLLRMVMQCCPLLHHIKWLRNACRGRSPGAGCCGTVRRLRAVHGRRYNSFRPGGHAECCINVGTYMVL